MLEQSVDSRSVARQIQNKQMQKKVFKQNPYKKPIVTCGLVPHAELFRQFTIEYLDQIGVDPSHGRAELLYHYIEV